MEKITVRKAATGDAEAIARLLTEVGKVHSEGRSDIYRSDMTKFDAEGVARMIERGEYLAFVAEENGEVCGETICRVYERAADGTYKARKWLYIDDLCVTEKCRGGQAARRTYCRRSNIPCRGGRGGLYRTQGKGHGRLRISCRGAKANSRAVRRQGMVALP